MWWNEIGGVVVIIVVGVVVIMVIVEIMFFAHRLLSSVRTKQQEKHAFVRMHAEHAQPPAREQLLCFGALMLFRNKLPTRILATTTSNEFLRGGLIEYWGISDSQSAQQAIRDLMIGGRRAHYDSDFVRMEEGAGPRALQSLDGKDYIRWKKAKQICEKEGLLLSCTTVPTLAAFDYERIAYLARTCFHLGYLSEGEMWRCLVWVARVAQAEFANWNDYAASFIMGRAATYDDDTDLDVTVDGVHAAVALSTLDDELLNRPHLWKEYSLPTISVPNEASFFGRSKEIIEPEPFANRLDSHLLCFGALSAWSHGESVLELSIPDEHGSHEQWLANAWNIADADLTLRCLDWLLEKGSRFNNESSFRLMSTGGAPSEVGDAFNAAAYIRFQREKEWLAQNNVVDVAKCKSMLAYDLERAAYLARVATSVGHISQDAARAYLRRVAMLARSVFVTWEDYFASFLLTHVCFNESLDYLKNLRMNGIALLRSEIPFDEYVSPWQRHLLKDLPVPHAV